MYGYGVTLSRANILLLDSSVETPNDGKYRKVYHETCRSLSKLADD